MSQFTIEKNVPIPSARSLSSLPFTEMEVGDSVLIPYEGVSYMTLYGRLNSALRRLGDREFLRRVESGKGIRVWRTK